MDTTLLQRNDTVLTNLSYWIKYAIVCPNQLTAIALVMQYWVPRDHVNPGVYIAVFLVVIIGLNYWGIKAFGEIEFWLSCFKVVTIVGVIILTLVLACGGGPTHDTTGFRYWHNPGAFSPWTTKTLRTDSLGKFEGFWSTLVIATFAYGGTELVGVTIGEAQNPRKTIPKAIKLTFYRILFFYIFSVFLLGMVVPYTAAAKLTGSTAAASPFVLAIKLSKIKGLDQVLNGCILLFVFSAANSDLYTASRTLYGLATVGSAPAIFKRTNPRGVPIYSLAFCASFALLAFMNVSTSSAAVFTYFVNLTTMFGLLTWISLLTTHIFFVKARKAQGITNDMMPFVAPLGATGSYIALGLCILVAITKNFDAFVNGFAYKTFITGYLGIPVYLILVLGYKFIMKPVRVTSLSADFYTGKDIVDREEEEYLAAAAEYEAVHGKNKGSWFYNKFVAWLF